MTIKKWPTVVAVLGLVFSLSMNWQWIWGVFFMFWAIDGIRKKESYLVEPVKRSETPVMYWGLIAFWAGLGVYSFL